MKIELLKGEVFKRLTDHIGISNYGRVFNRDRKIFVIPKSTAQGYLFFDYKQRGERFRVNLARTLLKLHNPVENEKEYYVKYLDGNKSNVTLNNLSWDLLKNRGLTRVITKYISLEGEIFKEYGDYQVSNFGTVTYEGRKLKPVIINNKYFLRHKNNNSNIEKTLNKIVATYFIENPNNYNSVRHIDGNLLNCKADNLEWTDNIRWNLPDQEIICEPGEYYLPCPIAGDNYYLSNFGTLRNIKSKEPRQFKEAAHGYNVISHKRGGKEITLSQHRLLMTTFKPVEGMENLFVNHIDHNPSNNILDNLEWVTRKENNQHAYKEGWCATEYNGIVKSTKGRYKMTISLGIAQSLEEAINKIKEAYTKLDLDTKYLKRDKK